MKERDSSIDIAKGIGIFLVVLGHTTDNNIIAKWLHSFHMPLFFFLSGLFHIQLENYKNFLIKKVRGLLIPYFFFAIILFLFFIVISKNIGFSAGENLSIKENFIGIFIGCDILGFSQISWGGQLWFLLSLFIVSNVCYFIMKLKLMKQLLINVIFLYIGIKLLEFNIILPWNIISSIFMFNFYWIGVKVKYKIINEKISISKFFVLLLFFINIICTYLNTRVNVYYNKYGNLFLFFIASYSGIFFLIFFIRKVIKKNNLMEYIGKNSIVILAFHRRAQTFTKVLAVFLLKISIPENNIIFDMFYSLWQIGLCIPIIYILDKYFPYILGRKKNAQK